MAHASLKPTAIPSFFIEELKELTKHPTAYAILLYLASQRQADGTAKATYAELRGKTGAKSDSVISRALKYLEAKGHLERTNKSTFRLLIPLEEKERIRSANPMYCKERDELEGGLIYWARHLAGGWERSGEMEKLIKRFKRGSYSASEFIRDLADVLDEIP